jgi:hypothetical protein
MRSFSRSARKNSPAGSPVSVSEGGCRNRWKSASWTGCRVWLGCCTVVGRPQIRSAAVYAQCPSFGTDSLTASSSRYCLTGSVLLTVNSTVRERSGLGALERGVAAGEGGGRTPLGFAGAAVPGWVLPSGESSMVYTREKGGRRKMGPQECHKRRSTKQKCCRRAESQESVRREEVWEWCGCVNVLTCL